jgi:transposase
MVRRRTQLSNAIRGYAAEFGLVAARGLGHLEALLVRIAQDESVPELAKDIFAAHGQEYAALEGRITQVEARLMAWFRQSEPSQRLTQIPGIGPIIASMLVMKVPDPGAFHSARHFAAWLGLTPKDHSTAGKTRLGVITRAGDEDLRRLLVSGAMSVIQQAERGRGSPSPWLLGLLKRKELKLVAVALANKMARIAWKLLVSGENYDPRRAKTKALDKAA